MKMDNLVVDVSEDYTRMLWEIVAQAAAKYEYLTGKDFPLLSLILDDKWFLDVYLRNLSKQEGRVDKDPSFGITSEYTYISGRHFSLDEILEIKPYPIQESIALFPLSERRMNEFDEEGISVGEGVDGFFEYNEKNQLRISFSVPQIYRDILKLNTTTFPTKPS